MKAHNNVIDENKSTKPLESINLFNLFIHALAYSLVYPESNLLKHITSSSPFYYILMLNIAAVNKSTSLLSTFYTERGSERGNRS